MRWFNSGKPKELWDEAIQWPIDDLEAAGKIRDICNSAVGSAEKVGRQVGRTETKANKYETERYKRAAKAAMEIAIKISDDLMRDAHPVPDRGLVRKGERLEDSGDTKAEEARVRS
jgi:hypothetical protein